MSRQTIDVATGQAATDANYVAPALDRYPTREAAQYAMLTWIDSLTAQITAQYPDSETKAWDRMEAAARAYALAGAATDARYLTFIDNMLKAGETREDLTGSIIANADRFSRIAALVRKTRSATEDALNAVSTPAEWASVIDGALTAASAQAAAEGLVVI